MEEYIYAVLQDGIVTNVILSDNNSAHDALRIMLNASDVILVNEETGPAYINGDVVSNKFRPPSPYTSWKWDAGTWTWQPPTPAPSVFHMWDEESTSWMLGPSPFPSWTWDEADSTYVAPIPSPGDNYYWDEDAAEWIEVTPEVNTE